MNILENLRLAHEYLSTYATKGDLDAPCRECYEHLSEHHGVDPPDCDLGHAMEYVAKAMRPLEYPEDYPEEAAAVREFVCSLYGLVEEKLSPDSEPIYKALFPEIARGLKPLRKEADDPD